MKIKMILRKYVLNVLIILAEIASIVLTFLFLTDLTQFLWLAAFIVNFIAYLWILNLDTNPEFKIP